MSTPKRKSKRRVSTLIVVFDTNAIYTASGSNLVNNEVAELIKTSSKHKGNLNITWHLPETVRNEREYQLRKHGFRLVQDIRKLEKFLDHELLPLADEIIIQRLNHIIEQQIKELAINVMPVNVSKVDWQRVMVDAAFREPPFSPEKEKGFRDALIAEALFQLIESSPKNDDICRIALITADELLTNAIIAKTVDSENVVILPSVEELKGLINTLVSPVDENLIQQLKIEATRLFFEAKNRETYFYKAKIKETILDEFAQEFTRVPAGASEVRRGKTIVGRPRFKEKVVDRIHWVTRVIFQMESYIKYLTITPEESQRSDLDELLRLYANGEVVFEVSWSVALTTGNKLTKPKTGPINHIRSGWFVP